MMAAMEITEDTPMTIPSTVKAERTLDERNVSSAANRFSRVCARVIMAISRTSKPQSGPAVTRAMPDIFRKTIRLRSSEILLAPRPTFRPPLGTAHIDFPSPQVHTYQHHVHDDDSADDH